VFKAVIFAFSIGNAFFVVLFLDYVYGLAEAAPQFIKFIVIIYVAMPPAYLYSLMVKKPDR